MDQETALWIVESAMGYLAEQYRCAEVENLFAGNAQCMRLYSDVIDAYWRMCEKLGIESDPDGEIMINSFMKMTDIVAMRMFEYGIMFGKKV